MTQVELTQNAIPTMWASATQDKYIVQIMWSKHIKDINYINAHATSTLVGDIAEVNAVKKAFNNDLEGVKMNGTKSMVGHCLGAAAGVEAVATIMAIKTGWLHPTLNNDDPIDEVAGIDICANEKVEHKVTAAISNSFGFGGHNSCCIFAPYEA